jgi:hypothetical protein
MESFLHEQKLKLLRRHLAASDPTKNWGRHNMLLRLLAEEEAREKAVPQEWSLLGRSGHTRNL